MGKKKNKFKPLELDGYGSNIVFAEDGLDEGNAATFYDILPDRPVMAMLAAVLDEYIERWWDLPHSAYDIYIYDYEGYKAFQFGLDENLSEEDQDSLTEFLALVATLAEENPHIDFDQENGILRPMTERDMLNFLSDLADADDLTIDPDGLEDPQAYHAKHYPEDERSWEEAADFGLKQAWVVAALPQKPLTSKHHLLMESYAQQQRLCYDLERIEALIERKEQAVNAGTPNKPLLFIT